MPAGLGSASSLRVKAEATAGTRPATGFFVVPVTGFDMIPRAGTRKKSAVLGDSFAATNVAFRGPIGVRGKVGAEGGYNGSLDWLLYMMLGAKATTGGGVDPYTNIYTPGATPPTYHAEHIAGNIPAGKCYRYQNMVASSLALSGDANGNISAQAEIVAEKEASVSGGDTPTTAGLVTVSDVPIQNTHGTIWNMGVGSNTLYCLKKWSLKLSRPLAPDRACVGSAFYKAPTFVGPLELDYEFEIEWEDEAMYRAFVNATVLTAIQIKYVGGAILTGFYTLDMRVNRSDLDEAGPPEWNTNGALSQILKGTGYGNAGAGAAKEPISVTTINSINGAVI